MSWMLILGRSDKASNRESDDIKFIYFYQTDGVVIWIYAIFLFIFCENKNLKEVYLFVKFQCHIVNNYKVIIFISFK